jgi:mRNA interferase MazF
VGRSAQRRGSGPGFRRPVLVTQSDSFSRSSIQTVIIAVITSNLRLAQAPGNVPLPARASHLPKDSVVNVSQLLTLDRGFLTEPISTLSFAVTGIYRRRSAPGTAALAADVRRAQVAIRDLTNLRNRACNFEPREQIRSIRT